MTNRSLRLFVWSLLMALATSAFCQDAKYDFFYNNSLYASNWDKLSSEQRYKAMWFSTPEYRKEALNLVLSEANKIAKTLKLSEKLPITKSNLTEVFIDPPIMEIKGQGVGNVSTESYTYFVTDGNKLSRVTISDYDQKLNQFVEKYHWPASRIDTNAAKKLAVKWVTAASMDMVGLNRDCQMCIEPTMSDEPDTNHFAPVYRVEWRVPANNQFGWHAEASVALFLPTKTLLDLTVSDPKYILGLPVVVTNMDYMSNLVRVVSEQSGSR